MSEKDVQTTDTTTKPQENSSPTTSSGSSSEKPERPETIDEIADRVGNMIIENLKNRANHPDYREYPGDK
jgi:hypothetical protein